MINSVVEISVLSECMYRLEVPVGQESEVSIEHLKLSNDIEEIGYSKPISVQTKRIITKGSVEGCKGGVIMIKKLVIIFLKLYLENLYMDLLCITALRFTKMKYVLRLDSVIHHIYKKTTNNLHDNLIISNIKIRLFVGGK